MNLSEFVHEDNATSQLPVSLFDVNVTEQQQQEEGDVIDTLFYVMSYVCLALGVPGNILSAIIWLRRHVISKNSSALHLAVLAISDLLFLLFYIFIIQAVPSIFDVGFWVCIYAVFLTTEMLEPLLVLSFSVERLIAISCRLKVDCVYS